MSLAFARRRQAEAKKRELKNAQGNVVGEKTETEIQSSGHAEENESQVSQEMDSLGPKEESKASKKDKKNSKRV